MIRLLVLLGLLAFMLVFFRWLFRQPPKVAWQGIIIIVAVGLLLLVATGRAHWLAAVFAALLPFIRAFFTVLNSIPLIKRVLAAMGVNQSAAQPGDGQTSTVQSQYIRMTLDHDSGEMNGEILQGQFEGKTLKQLNLDELLVLLQECQQDAESVSLLQAYLDREFEDEWRQKADTDDQRQTTEHLGGMTREEALQVLGLSSGASDDEIIEAHRKLIQKLHPDRGGSHYLAAKINQAKETLLGD